MEVFLKDIWNPHLKPNIRRALSRAKEELKHERISVVLMSGGSANIGWLRELLLRDFYDEFQATPSSKEFSIEEKFDAAATHPSFDPGGPDDLGVPPEPVITSHAHIDFTGQRVKVKLSGTSGPKEPMIILEVIGRSI